MKLNTKKVLLFLGLGIALFSVLKSREYKSFSSDIYESSITQLSQKYFANQYFIQIYSDEPNSAKIEYAFGLQSHVFKCSDLSSYDVAWNSMEYVAMKDYYLLLFKAANQGDTCVYLPRNPHIEPAIFTNVIAIDSSLGQLAFFDTHDSSLNLFELKQGKSSKLQTFKNSISIDKIKFAGFVHGILRTDIAS